MRRKILGNKIRAARERLYLTREQAAKKIGISAGYLAHLEYETPVRLSFKLLQLLQKKLGLTTRLGSLVKQQNARATKYYSAYRRKHTV